MEVRQREGFSLEEVVGKNPQTLLGFASAVEDRRHGKIYGRAHNVSSHALADGVSNRLQVFRALRAEQTTRPHGSVLHGFEERLGSAKPPPERELQAPGAFETRGSGRPPRDLAATKPTEKRSG